MWLGKKRYWLFQVIGWGSLFAIYLFFHWSLGKLVTYEDRKFFFSKVGIFILSGIVLTHIMRFFIIRYNLLQEKLEKQIAQFVFFTTLFSFAGAIIDIVLRQRLDLLSKTESELLQKKNIAFITLNNALTFLFTILYGVLYILCITIFLKAGGSN